MVVGAVSLFSAGVMMAAVIVGPGGLRAIGGKGGRCEKYETKEGGNDSCLGPTLVVPF